MSAETVAGKTGGGGFSGPEPSGARAVPLSGVEPPDASGDLASSGFAELDALLGSGLIPGAALLLGGEPGVGKSTLLLQVAGRLAGAGGRVLYCSGEESLPQLSGRARRLGATAPELCALATNSSADVLAALDSGPPPALVVVDSVQTLASPGVDGVPGSVSQVRTVAAELVEAVKTSGATLILVGHVTKDGQIAGPRLLEHMVDTVLYLEGDRARGYRILRVLKNRFGPSDELVLWRMADTGMEVVPDPSTFFLESPGESHPGAAVVMTVDGGRPFAVEVQALAATSCLGIPRRTALGFDAGRLHLLLAVLEKRLGLNFAQLDVYAKIGGGLKLAEPGLDLGLAAAILSSFADAPLPAGSVYWGEVDLSGRIRVVAAHDLRHKQALALGYTPRAGVAHRAADRPTLAGLWAEIRALGR